MHMVITCIKVNIKLSTLAVKILKQHSSYNIPLSKITCFSIFHVAYNFTCMFADVVPWLVQTVLGVFSSGTPSMELFCSHIPVIKVM